MGAAGKVGNRILVGAALLAGGWGALHALVTFLRRFTHPFQLEWSEGTTFLQAVRLLREGVIFTDPWSADFIPHLYTPLHTLVLGGALTFLPAELWVGRLLSLLAAGACALFLWGAARRCGAGPGAALLAPLGLLAAAPLLEYWYDLVRVDMLFAAFLAAALWLHLEALAKGGKGPLLLSALCLVLAALAKQSALAYGPLFLLPLLPWLGWRRALLWGGAAGLLLAGAFLALQAWSGGWFWYYCFEVLGRHPGVEGGAGKWHDMWISLAPFAPLLAAALYGTLERAAGAAERGRRFCQYATLWGLPFAVYAFMKHGGWHNAWLPLLVTALPAAAGACHRLRGLPAAAMAVTAALPLLPLVGHGFLLANRLQIPFPGDAAAQRAAVAQIRRAGTPVWCPNNSWVAWRACGEIRPMLHLVGELFASGGEGGSRLPRPLVRELEERRLAVLVFQESPVPMMGDSYSFLARDPRFRPLHRLIGRHYRVEEPIPISWPTPISGYPRVGLQVRPARIVPAREEP